MPPKGGVSSAGRILHPAHRFTAHVRMTVDAAVRLVAVFRECYNGEVATEGTAMASTEIYDLTIIGAGPAGLFPAYYPGFPGLRPKLIDSHPGLGGQVTHSYPAKHIYT